ncbi:MAG: kynureninase, partial [Psychrosphaera sp.]|nr:kynureninase [Psychrosphaera sp.]
SLKLTGYMEYLLKAEMGDRIHVITPADPAQRGCQLSLSVRMDGKEGKDVFNALEAAGCTTDWREPNVIRCAPVPLYNSFVDVYDFVQTLKACFE